MEFKKDDLYLIYINKIGYNSKGCGFYEFIFTIDPETIDIEGWSWDLSPACDHAEPPAETFVNALITLKTKQFNLFCLHEAVDRPYTHGYHTIHALAYEDIDNNEIDGHSDYDRMFSKQSDGDDYPVLVFHYGMSLSKVIEKLSIRKIILRDDEFIDVSSVKI